METCKLTRHGCNYAPFNPKSEECHTCVEREEICSIMCSYCDTDSVDFNSSYPKVLLDTRAIKPEKYAELREQDFDTWLDTILHEIIEQVNFDASEVDALGGAVWNGECPDGTPYPKECAREDAYIQCIRQSNQLDAFNAKLELLDDKIHALKDYFEDLEAQINDLSIRFDEFKKFTLYSRVPAQKTEHTGSDFCGNCTYCARGKQADDTVYVCKLSHEIVDPDDSSCAKFEPPF